MPKLAKVITLYGENAADIAAMLRQAADNIETEASEGFVATRMMAAVQISDEGYVRVYGWGRTDTLDSIAALEVGAAYLKRQFLELQED